MTLEDEVLILEGDRLVAPIAVAGELGGDMLIATFNETTGWRGKTITFEDEHFVLEGHGHVSPKNWEAGGNFL